MPHLYAIDTFSFLNRLQLVPSVILLFSLIKYLCPRDRVDGISKYRKSTDQIYFDRLGGCVETTSIARVDRGEFLKRLDVFPLTRKQVPK